MAGRVTASIITIGNELLSGDTVNTNAAWLAQQLEELGVSVTLMASLPDEIDRIADFVRAESENADLVIVTGGLGGTPDDVTREALAAAFEAPQDEVADLAERLRSRFPADPEYAARWANLPAGARPLENPLGGAPGFVVANVFVLPGLPAEMKAMFGTVAHELQTEQPITSWRRVYETTEDRRRPRGHGRPLPRRARRLVSEVPRRGRHGRGRREVVGSGGARGGGRLDRAGPRGGNGPTESTDLVTSVTKSLLEPVQNSSCAVPGVRLYEEGGLSRLAFIAPLQECVLGESPSSSPRRERWLRAARSTAGSPYISVGEGRASTDPDAARATKLDLSETPDRSADGGRGRPRDFEWVPTVGQEGVVRPVRMLLVLLGVAVLPFSVAACGSDDGDEATRTVTVTATATGAADKGKVVKVELGEDRNRPIRQAEQTTVEAGKVTFAVTNVGELYHEFIVYSNFEGCARRSSDQ